MGRREKGERGWGRGEEGVGRRVWGREGGSRGEGGTEQLRERERVESTVTHCTSVLVKVYKHSILTD